MNDFLIRRGLGAALALTLGLSLLPLGTLAAEAEGLCSHHQAHTADCGYSENQSCSFAVSGCEDCGAEETLITIKGTDVTIGGYSFPYTGEEIRPEVTVTVNGETLAEDTHYRLTYKDNVAAGTGSVTVTGMAEAGYEGIVTIPFTIEAPLPTAIELQADHVALEGTEFPATGEAIEPQVTVTVEDKVLTPDQDYTLAYENNIRPGTASVTVTGIDAAGYTGQVTVHFTITEKPEEDETPEDPGEPEEDAPQTTPVEYQITKGDKSTWFQNSGKRLSFVTSGNILLTVWITSSAMWSKYLSPRKVLV